MASDIDTYPDWMWADCEEWENSTEDERDAFLERRNTLPIMPKKD